MKTRYLLSMGLLAGSLLTAAGTDPLPDTLFREVLENNRALRTARESYQVSLLAAGTGNTPPDPEIELGYLYGKPSDLGNRIDFRVSQQVEFPTVYMHRSSLRKIRASQAELEFLLSRQEVLLQAKKLWIERIHLNRLQNLLADRLSQAEVIHAHLLQKLEAGEVAQLAFSQSALQLAVLQDEYEKVLEEIRGNRLAMVEVTGGKDLNISDTLLPKPVLIDPDSLLNAYAQSPDLLLHQQQLQLKQEQKQLTVSQNLPKLSAGYYSESVMDQQFKGVHVGVTVPLWENVNRIKQARSEVVFAESDADRFAHLQRIEIMQGLDRLENLISRSSLLEEALGSGNSIRLLALAVESGEISLSEYFYASDFYFRQEQLLLRYKKEQLLLEAELMKVFL